MRVAILNLCFEISITFHFRNTIFVSMNTTRIIIQNCNGFMNVNANNARFITMATISTIETILRSFALRICVCLFVGF